eukprot:12936941-Prorocentrum_lima.AAC.1
MHRGTPLHRIPSITTFEETDEEAFVHLVIHIGQASCVRCSSFQGKHRCSGIRSLFGHGL